MGFSADDRIVIENLCKFKKYGARRLIREFPTKGWSVSSVNTCWRNYETPAPQLGVQEVDVVEVRALMIVDSVNELVLSQEGAPKTHQATRQIASETGIHHSSVYRIVRQNLKLNAWRNVAHRS